MRKNHLLGGKTYISPDIQVQSLDVELGFAESLTGKWNDSSNSSADFSGLSNVYDGEFE